MYIIDEIIALQFLVKNVKSLQVFGYNRKDVISEYINQIN